MSTSLPLIHICYRLIRQHFRCDALPDQNKAVNAYTSIIDTYPMDWQSERINGIDVMTVEAIINRYNHQFWLVKPLLWLQHYYRYGVTINTHRDYVIIFRLIQTIEQHRTQQSSRQIFITDMNEKFKSATLGWFSKVRILLKEIFVELRNAESKAIVLSASPVAEQPLSINDQEVTALLNAAKNYIDETARRYQIMVDQSSATWLSISFLRTTPTPAQFLKERQDYFHKRIFRGIALKVHPDKSGVARDIAEAAVRELNRLNDCMQAIGKKKLSFIDELYERVCEESVILDAEIARKDAEIARKDAEIARKIQELAKGSEELAKKNQRIAQLERLIAEQEIEDAQSSEYSIGFFQQRKSDKDESHSSTSSSLKLF